MTKDTLKIDGREVPVGLARNLLEVARQAGIDIPTFCYHSELSIYGACRMCVMEIEGRGITTSCTTRPEPNMVVRTNTAELREMRRIAIELLLANHERECTTCVKSGACRLQDIARRLGVNELRFKPTACKEPLDRSSPSLVRDPNKCILCGDCVRACRELQGIGAIDFAHRGAHCKVQPTFGKDLAQVECVNCGLCASVCPTGALTPRQHVDEAWALIEDPAKTVVVQIAPAVRVALGEHFGMEAGGITTGQLVAALRRLGFDQVYDTSFAADLTVIEEAEEFIRRRANGGKLPLFTSCCPAWVTAAEQYFPDLLDNLSTCRSPQQMFAAVARRILPSLLDVAPENLAVVSIMPCTAKKAEAVRPEFSRDGRPDVDVVLTTVELARMIEQAGLCFADLPPESFDMPLGFKTGAGVIFGASGGVTEAVLRYAADKLGGPRVDGVAFHEVRGSAPRREAAVTFGNTTLRLAVVHGLANALKLAAEVQAGTLDVDLVEVMACPGGCVGGAGQPVHHDMPTVRGARTTAMHTVDTMLQLHKSQENFKVAELYQHELGQIGGETAHELLHTHYRRRRRLDGEPVNLGGNGDGVKVSVCVGTNCYIKGSQDILRRLMRHVREAGLTDRVNVAATFCLERCGEGPNIAIDDEVLTRGTFETVVAALDRRLAATPT